MTTDHQAQLEHIRAQLQTTTDSLGKPIDAGILETVLYLQALGIPTDASCEGHIDWGRPWPWVGIATENEPDVDKSQKDVILQDALAKHGITVEQLTEDDQYAGVLEEVRRQFIESYTTPEYQEWKDKNNGLAKKLEAFLDEFYTDRQVEPELRLEVHNHREGEIVELEPHEDDETAIFKDEIDPEVLQRWHTLLPQRQAEMQDFTKFLKRKYEEI